MVILLRGENMSKIVLAINSMISNEEKITDIHRDLMDSEFLFKYADKYVWGISKHEENYSLFFYPESKDVNELAGVIDWSNVPMVVYKTEDLKTREAIESFRELYLIVQRKLHNVDRVLDEIIGNMQ